MPEISVIVVNWNGKHFLETCLTALRRQSFRDFETILVDNGSEDGSAEYVRAQFPEVNLLELRENRGFTGGNIAGWEKSRGELIVLLNNDTEAAPGWLGEIHKASKEFPKAGSFASKMIYFDERKRIDNCGFAVTRAGLTIDLGRGEEDGPAWAEPRQVFGGCGGAVTYRRSMLEDVGFLDDDFFMTYEDVDLSFRAQLRGYECVFLPGAIVYHRYRATMAKHPARQVYFSQRNVEFVFLKNMPLGIMLRAVPQRMLYEFGGGVYFFKMGAGGVFLKSKMDAIRQLPAVLRKRKQIQSRRTVTSGQLRAAMASNSLGTKWKKLASAWQGASQGALRASSS
jgi:GT2 family glycosyltransferase